MLSKTTLYLFKLNIHVKGSYVKRIVLTDKLPVATVNVERVITLLVVGVAGLEEQTVGAELGLRDVVHALVVQVALLGIGEEAVLLRAVEL